MKNQKNKILTAITLLLLLTFASTLLMAMPIASAQNMNQKTWAFISMTPNPVGVSQTIHIRLFLQPFPPTGNDVYHNFQYIITKPDGTTQSAQSLTSDTNGAYDFSYVPTAIGSYTVQFTYPGETFSSANATDLASSATATFTAQQAPILDYPDAPLPTGYWTRPISQEFRSWYGISGNWLSQGYDASGRIYADATGFNPYTQAVRAPHIVWKTPLTTGGLIGGDYGPDGFYTGIQYNGLATPPLIVEGRLYYRLFMSSSGEKGTVPGFACVDLRTGEEYWSNTTGNINFAQVYNAKGYNGQGGVAMLYDVSTTRWVIYDAFTGTPLYYLTGAIANPDKIFYGPLGEVYAVKLSGSTQPSLIMWNSTKAFQAYGFLSGGSFRGPGTPGTYNWSLGMQYNVTAPSTAPFTLSQTGPHNAPADASTNTIMLIATPPVTPNNGSSYETVYNILTGERLWGPTRRDFEGTFTNRVATGEGLYVQLNAATLQRVGIDFLTGTQRWISDPLVAPWAQYSGFGANAYGMSYQGTYSGYMVALNGSTGKEVWSFSSGNSGLETPYGSWPMFNGPIVGGDVVYCGYSEHTPNEPLYRGAQLFALDAKTGKELWSVDSYLTVKAIADGYLVTVNAYDNQLYVLGKGPSKTTISAPQVVVAKGIGVLMTGTVTDQSPGAKDTPAISDESMADWMEYLYMQKPIPSNATGVPVYLTAIGPNGEAVDVGSTISDMGGSYGLLWTPPTEGKWTIMATFAGSDSYGSSYATAYLGVGPASAAVQPTAVPTTNPTVAPTVPPTAIPTSSPSPVPNTGSGIGTEVYIAIAAAAVIAIVAAAALILRKRK
jgi:hypothetical protein